MINIKHKVIKVENPAKKKKKNGYCVWVDLLNEIE